MRGGFLLTGYIISTGDLIIFFVLKNRIAALPISARDMTQSERKYYDKQKEN